MFETVCKAAYKPIISILNHIDFHEAFVRKP